MTATQIAESALDTVDQTNLCVVLRNSDRGLVTLLVADEKGRWSIPGGHTKGNETPAEACQREVKEETGLSITPTPLIWADHAARDIPANVFYALTFEEKVRPGGGDVTKTKWVSVKNLGELNGTDKLVILTAANKIYNPQLYLNDAVEIAESEGYSVGNLLAPPPVHPGIYIRLIGNSASTFAQNLSEWAANHGGWPVSTLIPKLTEGTKQSLARASAQRDLTPMMESLLLVSDSLWHYEINVTPCLLEGNIVLEVGSSIDPKPLLERGMPVELLETFIDTIPKPALTFDTGNQVRAQDLITVKTFIIRAK